MSSLKPPMFRLTAAPQADGLPYGLIMVRAFAFTRLTSSQLALQLEDNQKCPTPNIFLLSLQETGVEQGIQGQETLWMTWIDAVKPMTGAIQIAHATPATAHALKA